MDKTTWECLLLAGLGGMMPTLSKFGASLVADPNQAMPAIGFFVGLGIYFLMGSVMSYAFAERNLKQAFLAGIAAPALIASTISGVSGAQQQPKSAITAPSPKAEGANNTLLDTFFSLAHADEVRAQTQNRNAGEILKPKLEEERPKETTGYRYSIVSIPSGSSDWRAGNVNYRITLIDTAGNTSTHQLSAYANLDITTTKPIATFNVESNGYSSGITVVNSSNKGGKFVIESQIETQKDFLWALGAKGQPVVLGVNVQFLPSQ